MRIRRPRLVSGPSVALAFLGLVTTGCPAVSTSSDAGTGLPFDSGISAPVDAGSDGGVPFDGGVPDAGGADASVADAGLVQDAGVVDAGAPDAGGADAGAGMDAGVADAGVPDAGGQPVDAGADAGLSESVACMPTCNPSTGLCGPLEICTTTNPCTDLGGASVTTEITTPTCTTSASGRPTFSDTPPVTWTDATNGDLRAACEFIPSGASASAQVPLVIFLHGSHGDADDLYNYTSLRSKAGSFDLEGNGGNAGFAIVSVQGRNLHWLGPNPAGSHHDYLFRDLASPSTNPDVRNLDKLVDDLVATGKIDPHRIYLMGWSNGAFMSELYAIARFTTGTPGGNHVAAAVAYAGADPFNTPDATDPDCQLSPYPHSAVPLSFIHRSCDALVACDAEQQANFSVPPGYAVEDWLTLAATASGIDDGTLADQIIDYQGVSVAACTTASLCSEATGALNHLRWPDGVADMGGHDWEPTMLNFLSAHPHP